jgi:single-strand DNA-binding protein
MVNRTILIGRLTRDPELRTTSGGKDVVEFSIAVNKRIKPAEGPDADFFRVRAWGQVARYVAEYIGRGRLVAVDGRLEQRTWQDANGNKRESIEVVADNVNALDRPRNEAGANTSTNRAAPKPATVNEDEYDPFGDE